MFNRKKAVQLLIPINVLIWGFFVYRFYDLYRSEKDNIPISQNHTRKKIEIETDSYVLKLNYADPFLKEYNTRTGYGLTSTNKLKSTPIRNTISTKTATQNTLPDIKYLGLVQNSTSGVLTALVQMNGQSKIITPKEKVDGIIFKSFNKDSLIAKVGKRVFIVKR